MEEYSDITTIDELYSDEEISGKSYLFCVDNNIDTLQDLKLFFAESIDRENIPDDLQELTKQFEVEMQIDLNEVNKTLTDLAHAQGDLLELDNATTNETCSQSVSYPTLTDQSADISSYVQIYEAKANKLSVRALNCLEEIKRIYEYPSIPFFNFLLKDGLFKRIKSLKNVGSTTAAEIYKFAKLMKANGFVELCNYKSIKRDNEALHYGLEPIVNELIMTCSNRCKNVISRIFKEYAYSIIDLYNHFNTNEFNPLKLRNIGKGTVSELQNFIEKFSDIVEMHFATNESQDHFRFVSNKPCSKKISSDNEALVNNLQPIIKGLTLECTQRCRSVIVRTFEENNYSVTELYNYFNSSDFDPLKLMNIGKSTVPELQNFIVKFSDIVDKHIENNGSDINQSIIKSRLLTVVGLSNDNADALCRQAEIRQNRIPVFKLIDCVLKQDNRNFNIISAHTRVYNSTCVINRDEVGDKLGISGERVRQLQNKIFKGLMIRIKSWKSHFEFMPYRQYCVSPTKREDIFKDEGVDFSDDFIDVVLSILLSSEYTLIGDIKASLLSFYDKREALFVVPNRLASIFDFDKFLSFIQQKLNGKIYEDHKIDLNHQILSYFKDSIKFDVIDDILEYIRLMLYEKFQLIIDDGYVVFNKNTRKNIPEYIEDILKNKGEVMSFDEIYEEFERCHPGLTKSKNALRGSIIRSDMIAAISRSGNYALKEWSAKGIKAGTIKNLVYEYLEGFSVPQPLEDITEFVVKYRTTTDANSIYNNIMLDKNGTFVLLEINDNRFIALKTHKYGDEYINIKDRNKVCKRRSFLESMDALYSFVLANDRFPFTSSTSEEEMRISRFLCQTRIKRNKGRLSEAELKIFNEFENANIGKEISSDQYKWNLRYQELENYILSYNRLPNSLKEPSLYTWMSKQRSSMNKGSLNDEDTRKIRTLLELVI